VRRLDCALNPRTACRTAVSPHLKAVSSGFATLRATALQMIGSLRRRDTIPKWDITLIPIGLSFVQTHFREEPVLHMKEPPKPALFPVEIEQ
jgi:hypothetical protein